MSLSKVVDKKVTKINKIAKANGVSYQDALFTWMAKKMSKTFDEISYVAVSLAREHIKNEVKPTSPTLTPYLRHNDELVDLEKLVEGSIVELRGNNQRFWAVIHVVGEDKICGFLMNDVDLEIGTPVYKSKYLRIGQHFYFDAANIFEVKDSLATKDFYGEKEIKVSDFLINEMLLPHTFRVLDLVMLSTLDRKDVLVQVLKMDDDINIGVIINELPDNEPYFLNKGDVVTFFDVNVYEVKSIEDYEKEQAGEQAPTESESTTKES